MDAKYILWCDIQDVIGNASQWPKEMRRLFWTKNVTHWNRIMLATFVFVNGLNPTIFLEWVDCMSLAKEISSRNHFKYLLNIFEKNPSRYSFYARNVCQNEWQHLDGKVKHYLKVHEE